MKYFFTDDYINPYFLRSFVEVKVVNLVKYIMKLIIIKFLPSLRLHQLSTHKMPSQRTNFLLLHRSF
jgi:hypothetical protein